MALLTWIKNKVISQNKWALWLRPLACFFLMIILTAILARAIYQKEFNYITNTTHEVADMVRQTLTQNLDNRVVFLKSIAHQWNVRNSIPQAEFQAYAELLTEDLEGLTTIEWIGPDYHIHWVTPLEGNEALIGLDILFDKPRQDALKDAIAFKRPTITPPLKLKQGYDALIVYHPLFKDNEFDGFVAGILNIEEFIKDSIIEWDSNYFHVQLQQQDGQIIYGHVTETPDHPEWKYSREIIVFDKVWRLTIYPRQNFIDIHSTSLVYVIFIMGSIMSVMFMVIAYSMSKRQETSNKIKENELRLQSFVRVVPAAIAMLDRDLCYLSASHRWQSHFMKRHNTLVGKNIHEHFVFDLSQQSHLIESMQTALSGQGSEVQEDVFIDNRGKHIWLRYEVFPWFDFNSSIQGIVVCIEDITRQKEVEMIKNDFISTVSHELRTPLTAVFGAISILQHKLKDKMIEKEQSLMKTSIANCQRVIALVNDILDINKIEAGKMEYHFEEVDVCALVETVVLQNKAYADTYSISFKIEFERKPLYCKIDVNRFTQALVNLLSNAAKFSPKYANVDVSVFMNDLTHVNIAVRDYGPGIPLTFRQSIFDKFAQADASDTKSTNGTGLGLHITQAIITAFSGKIFFESKLDEGTTFYLQIPIVEGQKLPNVFALD